MQSCWDSRRPSNRTKLLLALPPVVLTGIDAAITLIGQPPGYWTDHALFNEANPTSAWLLSHGPVGYLLGKSVYLLLLAAVVVLLPRIFSLLAATSFVLGHGFGILTWLLYYHGISFYWLYLFFPALAGVVLWQAWIYFQWPPAVAPTVPPTEPPR